MLTRSGVVKLVDFGMVKLHRAFREPLTDPQQPIGTRGYSAPEQLADGSDVTSAADVYALGATMLSLLTCRVPEPRPQLPDRVPHELERLIDSMLQVEPRDRPQDCHDLAIQFAKWADAEALRLAAAGTQDVNILPVAAASTTNEPNGWQRLAKLWNQLTVASVVTVTVLLISGIVWSQFVGSADIPKGSSAQRQTLTFDESLSILQSATTPEVAKPAMDAVLRDADSPERQRQVVRELVQLPHHVPCPLATNAAELRLVGDFIDQIARALFALPAQEVVHELTVELDRGSTESRAAVSYLLKRAWQQDELFQQAIKVKCDDILPALEKLCIDAPIIDAPTLVVPLDLYFELTDFKDQDPFATPGMAGYLRSIVAKPLISSQGSIHPVTWQAINAMAKNRDDEKVLEKRLVEMACGLDGTPLPIGDRYAALGLLSGISTVKKRPLDESSLVRLSAGVEALLRQPFSRRSFWLDGNPAEIPSSPAQLLQDLLTLIVVQADRADLLSTSLQSIRESLGDIDYLPNLRSTVERLLAAQARNIKPDE